MSLVALALVLAAAGFHAAWNLTLQKNPDQVAAMAVSGVISGLILLPATLVTPPWPVLPLIVLSGAAEAAYGFLLAGAYRRGGLEIVYPIGRGTAPLLVTLGGWLVLAERPTPLGLLGAIILALGLALVATAGRRQARTAAVVLALLTGVAIAAYSLVDARAVRQVSPAGYLGPVLALQGVLMIGLGRIEPDRLRSSLRAGTGIALGSIVAYLLILFAFRYAEAGPVVTLRQTSILIGILLAGGQPGRRVWLGSGLVVLGLVLAAI